MNNELGTNETLFSSVEQATQASSKTSKFLGCPQCDQIGQFLKVLDNNFDYKSSPKRLLTFGLF